jgi:hypothetical protein
MPLAAYGTRRLLDPTKRLPLPGKLVYVRSRARTATRLPIFPNPFSTPLHDLHEHICLRLFAFVDCSLTLVDIFHNRTVQAMFYSLRSTRVERIFLLHFFNDLSRESTRRIFATKQTGKGHVNSPTQFMVVVEDRKAI